MKTVKVVRVKFHLLLILIIAVVCGVASCKKAYTPKPRGYHRIDFPQKQYQLFKSDCNFQFEVPVYSTVKQNTESYAEKCWYNVNFTGYNASIYLTYKPIKKNLPNYIEDVRTIVYKHAIKADDIIDTPIIETDRNVYPEYQGKGGKQ